MNFEQYTREAKKTITFDSNEKLLFCCTTGLMGEFSEYMKHLQHNSDKNLKLQKRN